jgi:carboxylate-amine ligase
MPMTAPSLSIGIEEEFQVIDPVTRSCVLTWRRSFAPRRGAKPELHQPVVEMGTNGLPGHRGRHPRGARAAHQPGRPARENGLRIAAAGTHPFSHWADVPISEGNPRYERLIHDLQMVARANLIFGLHVHVGSRTGTCRSRS